MFSLEKRRLQTDLIAAFQHLKRPMGELRSIVIRDNSFKLGIE